MFSKIFPKYIIFGQEVVQQNKKKILKTDDCNVSISAGTVSPKPKWDSELETPVGQWARTYSGTSSS